MSDNSDVKDYDVLSFDKKNSLIDKLKPVQINNVNIKKSLIDKGEDNKI